MAFSKISNTEVSGTGTIADLVTTIANTSYAEQVGIRTVWLKSTMTVSGSSSELTIPAGWHVDVDTRLALATGATLTCGSLDAYGPDETASLWFDDATPGDWTDGALNADDNDCVINLYNTILTFNSNGSSNRACTLGNNKYSCLVTAINTTFCILGTEGSIYLANLTADNVRLIGGVGGEWINSPLDAKNMTFKRMGVQGMKVYPADVTVRNLVGLGDCDYVLTVDNGRTYTLIDSAYDDDQVIFDSDGSNLDDNTILEQYSINGTYSIAGVAQTGVAYRALDNTNTVIDSGTVTAGGALTEIVASAYRHNEGDHGTTFTNRNGDWYIPWRYRARRYDLTWQELTLLPSAAVDVSTGLPTDTFVTQASGTASAHTGITVTDHGSSPTTWQSKKFGITVTGNLTTNPSLTAEDIKHYLKYHLSSNTTFNGKAGLEWHDLIPMSGTRTMRGWVFGPRLTATCSASATTISISSNAGLPSSGTVKIEDEEIAYTGTTSTSLTGCSRGQNGTTPAIHTFANGNPLYFLLAKGVRVVDESGNSFPGITAHESDDASVYYAPVPIKVIVKDAESLALIQGARVYLETASGGPASPGVEIINTLTDVNGEVNDVYAYEGDQPVIGRVRKGTP